MRRLTAVVMLTALFMTAVSVRPVFAQGSVNSNRLQQIQVQHQEHYAKLSETLTDYLAYCEGAGKKQEAARIRKLLKPFGKTLIRIESLPTKVRSGLGNDLSEEERAWRVRVDHAQKKEYAQELYLLSRRALHDGFPSYAYQLVREVAVHDSDHKAVRRLLGYVQYGSEWLTPYAAEMARKKYEWHDKFGWLPRDHVARYENGERYFKRRWISAAQEAELRRDFRNAWEIRTEHFLVETNHSLERGVEIATALEEYYQVFYQTFAAFFNTPNQLRKLFTGNGGNLRRAPRNRLHKVHYYRTRDEYIQRLVKKEPLIGITNGLYFTSDRTSYFYHDPKATGDATLFHEATHQLFYENVSRERPIAEGRDFWVIEGIACYMESFRQENGQYSLGDPMYDRFQAARQRVLRDNFYIPLRELTSMGKYEFQNHAEIRKNYSQSTGLTQFFMEYGGGEYRDALIEHLSQHYHRRPRSRVEPKSLAELTGVSFTELDKQYVQFSRRIDEELARERVDVPQGE